MLLLARWPDIIYSVTASRMEYFGLCVGGCLWVRGCMYVRKNFR